MSQSLARLRGAPDHDNHHYDFHDRCLDCRNLIKPDNINADDDPQKVYCICFPELEDIDSDDSDDSSTMTDEDGLQPLFSGDRALDSPEVGIDVGNAMKALQHESMHFGDENRMLKKENQELKDWRDEMRAQYYTLEARLHRRNKTIQEQSYCKDIITQERDEAVKALSDIKAKLRAQTRERLWMLESYSRDRSAAEERATLQAEDYDTRLKETEELFEKRVTQIQEENTKEVDRLKLLIELRDKRIRKQGREIRHLVEDLTVNTEDVLDRQVVEMRREKRPRSTSPDGLDEPPRGRVRLRSPVHSSSAGNQDV